MLFDLLYTYLKSTFDSVWGGDEVHCIDVQDWEIVKSAQDGCKMGLSGTRVTNDLDVFWRHCWRMGFDETGVPQEWRCT